MPALPNLKSFTFTHYDPLCYPEDLSTFFLHGTKLETLNMHFSPRMRDAGEPSVVLTHFFRKNIAQNQTLRIRRIGLYNLLAHADSIECMKGMDASSCEHVTALNTFGPDEDDVASHRSATQFLDRTWLVPMPKEQKRPKSMRVDQVNKTHALYLGESAGLEYLYLINARHKREGVNGFTHSPPNRPSPNGATASSLLRDLYLDKICGVCGPTLKHLILPARWALSTASTAKLVRCCPNLTQLSAALEGADFKVLGMLVPFLSKLWAIRVLASRQEGDEGRTPPADLPDSAHAEKLASGLGQNISVAGAPGLPRLKYVGHWQKVWEIGGVYEEVVRRPVPGGDCACDELENGQKGDSAQDGWQEEIVYRRRVRRVTEEEVKDVEIWKMDSMDII